MERPSAVVLAGGAGRRIGGNKALVPLCGRPLLAHLVARLGPQCARLAINASAPLDAAAAGDLEVVTDRHWAGAGPLAGVLAAMEWAEAQGVDRVLTAPVDTPFLPLDYASRMMDGAALVVLAETADGQHGTCGLWCVSLRPALEKALASGTRKVTDFTRAQGAVACRFEDTIPPPFFNVNNPEDLDRAARYIRDAE